MAAVDQPTQGAPTATLDVPRRAVSGAIKLISRSVVTRTLGLAANVVIARILLPRDFGLLALGFTIYAFVGFLGAIGLGGTLVRRTAEPTRRELSFIMGVQFAVSGVALVVLGALIPVLGAAALVATIMLTTLPLNALRVPNGIMIERQLDYGLLARLDIVSAVLQAVASVTLVILGAGVYGVAVASPATSLAATLLLWRWGPIGPLFPRFAMRDWRPLITEGSWFVTADVVSLAEAQGLNVIVAGLGGLPSLGMWSLANRILLVPGFILATGWQISFPAMARLRDQGSDLERLLPRSVALTAVALGLPLAMIGGPTALLVRVVFGSHWSGVPSIVPGCSAAFLLAGPISVGAAGLLYASGRAKAVVAASIARTVTGLTFIAATFSTFHLAAIGWGAIASSIVDPAVFLWAIDGPPLPVLRAQAGPLLAALAAGATGWLVSTSLPATVPSLLAAEAAVTLSYFAILAGVARGSLSDAVALARTHLLAERSRRRSRSAERC